MNTIYQQGDYRITLRSDMHGFNEGALQERRKRSPCHPMAASLALFGCLPWYLSLGCLSQPGHGCPCCPRVPCARFAYHRRRCLTLGQTEGRAGIQSVCTVLCID